MMDTKNRRYRSRFNDDEIACAASHAARFPVYPPNFVIATGRVLVAEPARFLVLSVSELLRGSAQFSYFFRFIFSFLSCFSFFSLFRFARGYKSANEIAASSSTTMTARRIGVRWWRSGMGW